MTKRSINDPLDLTPPRTSPMEKGGANISSEQTSAYSRGTLSTILARPGPFTSETGALPMGEFVPGAESHDKLANAKVLVVGAGGLGCEILKDLAMSGVKNIFCIDLDTIDVTNLNRQFLFRAKDVGRPKCEVACEFVKARSPLIEIEHYLGKIQDKDSSFYSKFDVIVSGLDNIEARRWLNAMVVGLVQMDGDGYPDPSTIIPIVDGGTEGFKGQSRVIIPKITSCFECSLSAFPPQKSFPMCTIAETPRLPEHCISYAFTLMWPKEFPEKKLDKDSPDDMKWVFDKALERANKFNIKGVTYMLTMGVVKNIIPAVASTNAIISAACVNEVVKLITYSSQHLNTYMMYMGSTGIYTHSFVYEVKEDCPVCQAKDRTIRVNHNITLKAVLQSLCDGDLRLKNPSATTSEQTLYMASGPLKEATMGNLEKPVGELFGSGELLTVTDDVFPGETSLGLVVNFE